MRFWIFAQLALLALSPSGCAVNPVSGRPQVVLTSVEAEKELGREAAQQVAEGMGFADHGASTRYVEAIGRRLARHSPRQDIEYRFYVVDMVEPNAFALPGGHVYVSRGLLALANSEDELANVIGHEIGHAAARHSVSRQARRAPASIAAAPWAIATGLGAAAAGVVSPGLGRTVAGVGKGVEAVAGGLLLGRYSREQEREADRIGQRMAADAGWSPNGLAAFLSTLQREEDLRRDGPPRNSFFSSHPATPERAADARRLSQQLEQATTSPIAASREAFLSKLNGLLVGTPSSEGVFVDGRFLHPELAFSLRFPRGWETQNARSFVAGGAPEKNAVAVLEMVAGGNDPMEVAREFASQTQVSEGPAPIAIGALAGARALARVRAGGDLSELDLTWVAHRGNVYQVSVLSSAARYASGRAELRAIGESFAPLGARERSLITERRLRIVRAHSGESLERLVERAAGAWKPDETAVANAIEPGDSLRDGQLVKVARREPYTR
jgi:predicted Zn-dependent protease